MLARTMTRPIFHARRWKSIVPRSESSASNAPVPSMPPAQSLLLPSSLQFATLSSESLQKRVRLLVKMTLMASSMVGFVGWVYWYSMWAVRQDDVTDEFLEMVQQAERQMQEQRQSQNSST